MGIERAPDEKDGSDIAADAVTDSAGARGGWRAAIDARLAAWLLRPAVRAGISDPAHGRALAARLQRATAPSLAADVAQRYGTAELAGSRLPVVYAAPIPLAESATSEATGMTPPPADSAASAASGIAVAGDGGGGVAQRVRAGAGSAPDRSSRPVVRGSERASGPRFPRVRPLGAEPPVQRIADPSPPVVIARTSVAEPSITSHPDAGLRSRPTHTGDDLGSDFQAGRGSVATGDAIPISTPLPLVTPATRLRRQLAAEHAEAAAAELPVQRVRASVVAVANEERAPAAGMDAVGMISIDGAAVRQGDVDGSLRPVVPAAGEIASDASGDARLALASSSPGIAQRVVDPGPSQRVESGADGGMAMAIASPESPAVPQGPASAAGGARDHQTGSPLGDAPLAIARVAAGDGAADAVGAASPRVVAAPPIAQRVVDPGFGPQAESQAGSTLVVAPRGAGSGTVQRMALPVMAGSATSVAATRVVQAVAAGGGTRGASGGVAMRLVHAVPSAADGAAQRREATSTPPPGAPAAELPTRTADDGQFAGRDTVRLADEVYGLLVRRLESERKQRGW